jgi:MFS family permease
MLIGAGLPGIPAMVAAGSLSDRYGRRLVGCAASTLSIVGALAFFWIPGGVPVLLPAMSLMLVGSMASVPVLNGYATELFPTALRGQAGSWTAVARVGGQASSLAIGANLLRVTDSLPVTTTILGVGAIVAIYLYATAFPDTHGRDLSSLDVAPSIGDVGPVGPAPSNRGHVV